MSEGEARMTELVHYDAGGQSVTLTLDSRTTGTRCPAS